MFNNASLTSCVRRSAWTAPACFAAMLLLPVDRLVAETTLYDTLWIVDQCTEDQGYGNAWSGESIFGHVYDLQLAEDFESPQGGYLSEITLDSMSFVRRPLTTDVYVAIFADAGGRPAEDPLVQVMLPVHKDDVFSDCVFGLEQHRTTVRIETDLLPIRDGTNWLVVQPVDLTPDGDWFYANVDTQSHTGHEIHLRDGMRAGGGYHRNLWQIPYDFGDISIRIKARLNGQTPGPRPEANSGRSASHPEVEASAPPASLVSEERSPEAKPEQKPGATSTQSRDQ